MTKSFSLLASLLVVVALANAVSSTTTTTQSWKPQKVVIDTDIGRYMDDYFSIAYMVGHHHTMWHYNQSVVNTNSSSPASPLEAPLIDIRMVLTAYGNTTGRAELTGYFLDSLGPGAHDIDVGIGPATNHTTPSTNNSTRDGVGPGYYWVENSDYNFSTTKRTIWNDGLARLAEIIENEASEEEPLLILGIAPVVNLGPLFKEHPEYKKRVVLVIMGGSINIGYRGIHQPSAEDNTFTNVTDSRIVYHNESKLDGGYWKHPICAAPLDSTQLLQIWGQPYQNLLAAAAQGFSGASALLSAYESWASHGGICRAQIPNKDPCSPKYASPTLYDMQAGYQAIYILDAKRRKSSSQGGSEEGGDATGVAFDCSSIPFLKMEYYPHMRVNETGFTLPCCPTNATNLRSTGHLKRRKTTLSAAAIPTTKCHPCADVQSWTGIWEAVDWSSVPSIGGVPETFQNHAVGVLVGTPAPPMK